MIHVVRGIIVFVFLTLLTGCLPVRFQTPIDTSPPSIPIDESDASLDPEKPPEDTKPPTESEPPPEPAEDESTPDPKPPHPKDPPGETDPPNETPGDQGQDDEEKADLMDKGVMLDLINDARNKQQLPPLVLHDGASHLAQLKAQEMVDLNYFSHHSPTYGSPADMVQRAGISVRYLGENIARAGSATIAFAALMDSDGHRQNILGRQYTHVGLGIVEDNRHGSYGNMIVVVQLFLTPASY